MFLCVFLHNRNFLHHSKLAHEKKSSSDLGKDTSASCFLCFVLSCNLYTSIQLFPRNLVIYLNRNSTTINLYHIRYLQSIYQDGSFYFKIYQCSGTRNLRQSFQYQSLSSSYRQIVILIFMIDDIQPNILYIMQAIENHIQIHYQNFVRKNDQMTKRTENTIS